jgi:redox-sensitive bicupin YhaK (pirin superfamily)
MSEHGLFLVAAPLGQEAPVTLQQDVWLWQGRVSAGKTLDFDQKQKDHQWIHVIEGDLTLNGSLSLSGGDGVAVSRESELRMTSAQGARFLVFDLA